MSTNTDINNVENKLEFVPIPDITEREPLANIYGLNLYSKTITLLAGPSTSGKTVTCMHFMDKCISSGKTVLYVDTDGHPAMNRPDPNLLQTLIRNNPGKYNQLLKYTTSFSEEGILDEIEKLNPVLVVIDSIYKPYSKYPHPMLRAKKIREYLYKLRDKLMQRGDFAILLTSQMGKEVGGNGMVQTILGGEGLKHLSDTKWVIDFVGDKYKERRVFMIDRQAQILLKIDYGGILKPVEKT